MQPSGNSNLRDLALYDPIAAYGILLGIPRVPFQFSTRAVFTSFVVDQLPIDSAIDATIAQRTWIDNIAYSLEQPNVFAGNVLKTVYDSNLKAHPGVSVLVTVQSGPRYVLSQKPVPLENFALLIQQRWPCGWPLFKNQSISTQFYLTQAPPSTSPNAPPYGITLTFTGWQFNSPVTDQISPRQAADALRAAGIDVPAVQAIQT